jgi:hypothetical protein
LFVSTPYREIDMAKGQARSSKEKKKPKAEWNKKKKGGVAPSSHLGPPPAIGQSSLAKKA